VGIKEKGRGGVRSTRRRASDTPARRETRERGVRYGNEGEKFESRQVCQGKRGVQCKGKASAAPCRGHVSATHVGPTTDGFRRAHRHSDPASVARSAGIGPMSRQAFQNSRPLMAVLSLSLFSLFFSLLNPACTSLSYTLRSEHTCFFQTPLSQS
jgi:hypothetical protein